MSLELTGLAHPSHGRLLDIIRAAGPVSRVEIAQVSGMTPASVTNIVRTLLDMHLVQEVGQAESTGGKRRTLLAIAPESRYAVGIHVQEASTLYTVADLSGQIVGRREATALPTDQGPAVFTAQAGTDVESFLNVLGIDRLSVVGAGVVTGEALGVASATTAVERDLLQSALRMPVITDREAVAAAVGEFWQGTSAQPGSFAAVFMGEDFGVGFVNDGIAWRGSTGRAGRIGHIPTALHRPSDLSGANDLHSVASPAAVVAVAKRAGVLDESSGGSVADQFDALALRAVNEEAQPLALLSAAAEHLATVLAIVSDVVDSEMYVLAGPGFAVAGAIYAREIRRVLAGRHAGVQVQLAHNPRDAAAIGAAALVLQRALAPRS